MPYLPHPSHRIRTGVVLTVLVALPLGIVHAPQHDASEGMVREAPRSPTESGMVHDPSARGHDALSGKPATNGVTPHRRSERIAPATD